MIKEKLHYFPFAVYHEVLGSNPPRQLSTEQVQYNFVLILNSENPMSRIILSLSSWPHGYHDHPHLGRSLCCSIEDDDEEEEKGPMRATAYTVSDTVLSQVIFYYQRDDCNINVIIKIRLIIIVTIIIRFLETL